MPPRKLSYTETADKFISSICLKFHRRKEYILPESTWVSLGFSEEDKIAVFKYIGEVFEMVIYEKDYPDIPTVWDLLRYVEGHDSFRNVPERNPINGQDTWGIVCVSPNCRFPRHVKLREQQNSMKK